MRELTLTTEEDIQLALQKLPNNIALEGTVLASPHYRQYLDTSLAPWLLSLSNRGNDGSRRDPSAPSVVMSRGEYHARFAITAAR
ncbi:hypothetical protein FE257_004686 [Aspergillus nanangensis]|uniref:Uncharacterized protein n=1 Tax=Aspergillus nanangensis TaxID=2582783 RepID=A0AAD4CYY9_ASPNN|nr:hypothetical protein FE257_004686 [Aspergillus nanangensis]